MARVNGNETLAISLGIMARITLLTGTPVDTGNIHYDPSDFSFTLVDGMGVRDITMNLRASDKQAYFPDYNQAAYNEYLSQQRQPGATGSTSVLHNFISQITTDPLAAPIDALNKGVKQVVGSSGVQTIALLGGLALVAYLYFNATRK